MMNLNDTELMVKIQDGQHAAFEVLVRRYTKYFYAIAYRRLASVQVAEDITQQAFLKLWENPKKFDVSRKTSFKTWFAHVVVNLCADHGRRHKAPHDSLEDVEVVSLDDTADMELYKRQVMDFLNDSLTHLPASQQMAIQLGFYSELPYDQVARRMNTSVSAVKSLIVRAKENLKNLIKEKANAKKTL